MNKNLVIVAVGDESVHSAWLAGPNRTFDLAIVYYGNQSGRFAGEAEHYIARKGIKFAMLHDVLSSEWAYLIDRYERVWFPDDDVGASTEQIDHLFQLAEQHQLAICQPAIGRGDVSFQTLRARQGYLLRYTRFVEMMCPLFSREALLRVLPTFNANASGWGIDWLWASQHGPEELAVIDAVAVDHTRPLQSGGVHQQFAAMGIDPKIEYRELMQRHGISNRRFNRAICRGKARLRGISLDGRRVWTRSWLAAALNLRAA